MSEASSESKEFRKWIIGRIQTAPRGIAADAVRTFGLTRQAVNRRLREMVKEGVLESKGNTRSREYALSVRQHWVDDLSISGLQEDVVWRLEIEPFLRGLPQNVLDICQYGFTEMLNNAIEHSGAAHVLIGTTITAAVATLFVSDHGVGIFNKIQSDHGFEDPRHAILELSKGKLTSDPESHTGQGIFFSSRMFDCFSIHASGLVLVCSDNDDWLLDSGKESHVRGTWISMAIDVNSERTPRQVFDRFARSVEDFSFARTHVPVRLTRYGVEQLVSRSQARRLLARFEKFREVCLDFRGIETIGQAFADEIFRVFRLQHPQTELLPLFVSHEIQRVIQSAQAELPEHLRIWPSPDQYSNSDDGGI